MHGQQNNEIGSLVLIKLKFKLLYVMNICAIFFPTSLTSFVLGPLLRFLQFVMDFCLSSNSFPVVLCAGVVVFHFTVSKRPQAPGHGGSRLLRKVGTGNWHKRFYSTGDSNHING